jgi:hypothetical protein
MWQRATYRHFRLSLCDFVWRLWVASIRTLSYEEGFRAFYMDFAGRRSESFVSGTVSVGCLGKGGYEGRLCRYFTVLNFKEM